MERVLTKVDYINAFLQLPEEYKFKLIVSGAANKYYWKLEQNGRDYLNTGFISYNSMVIHLNIIIKTLQLCRYVKTIKEI